MSEHRHHETKETDPRYPFSFGPSSSLAALSTGGTLPSGLVTYATSVSGLLAITRTTPSAYKALSTSPSSSISFPYFYGSSFPSGSGSAVASGHTIPKPSFTTAPASGVSSGSYFSSSGDPSAPYGNSSATVSGTAYSSGSATYTSSKGTAATAASISLRYPYSIPSSASKSGSPTSFDPSSHIIYSSGSSIRSYPLPNGTAAASTLPPSSGTAISTGSGVSSYPFPNNTAVTGSSGSSGPTVSVGTRGYPIVTGTAIAYNSSAKHHPYTFTNSTDPSGTAISGSASGVFPTGTISRYPTSAKGSAAATTKISSGYIYSYANGTGISGHSTRYLSRSYAISGSVSSKPSGAAASTGISSGKPSLTANSTDPASSGVFPTHGPYPFPSTPTKPSLILTSGTKGISASAPGASIYTNSSVSLTLTAITDYFPTLSLSTDPGTRPSAITGSSGTGTAVPPPPTIGTAISIFTVPSSTGADESSAYTYTPTTKLMPSEYYTHHGRKGRKHHVGLNFTIHCHRNTLANTV